MYIDVLLKMGDTLKDDLSKTCLEKLNRANYFTDEY